MTMARLAHGISSYRAKLRRTQSKELFFGEFGVSADGIIES
jgi:hypothetical protein